MLLHDQNQPFALSDFLENREVVESNHFAEIFILVFQNAGENSDAVVGKHSMKFREKADDDVGGQIAQEQIDRIVLHRVQRSAEQVDIFCGIAFEIRTGNFG